MNLEQMIAWLTIEGWQYRGETIKDNASAVKSECIVWMGEPNSGHNDDYDMTHGWGNWNARKVIPWEYVRDDHVQEFYRYIQEKGL